MSLVDDFLNSGGAIVDAALGTETMVVSGQTFEVVTDDVSKSESGEEMGLTGDYSLVAAAQPKDVSMPAELINRRCTVGGIPYRISRVRVGTVAIHFELQDPSQK